MHALKTTLLFTAFTILTASPSGHTKAQTINVIPTPQEVEYHQGVFTLTPQTRYTAKGKGADAVVRQFRDALAAYNPAGATTTTKGGTITFEILKDTMGAEAYTLNVTPQSVTLRATTTTGLYYGMQTLLQLLTDGATGTIIPCPALTITDAPRFSYRGVMLDPCRHFLSISAVKKQIDALAAYKINTLHWHLTDDQAWRIEIKKYPQLTTTAVNKGYYTQAEIREVVDYAAARHITVIPEIEMPGHAMAAIAAYPWLACQTNSEAKARRIWGVEDIVLCPGKETTFAFIQDVLDEVLGLFPSTYIHIGGDEAPRKEWQRCDDCKERMAQEHLTQTAQLQDYLVGRVGQYLRARGRRLIGWDEILEGGGIDSTATIMSWRGGHKIALACSERGNHVIMTPAGDGFYFDQYQSDAAVEPTAIGGRSTLDKVYNYNPVPKELSASGKSDYVLGIQANCWSEYMPDASTLEYRLWPRALALAEVAWTQPQHKAYNDFVRRVDNDATARLKRKGFNLHIPAPEQPGGSINTVAFTDTMHLALTSVRPERIVYTTDGTQPTINSTTYTAPIVVDRTTAVRTACVLPCGIMGPIRTIYLNKELLQPAVRPSLNQSADPNKSATDSMTLSIYRGTIRSLYKLPETPTETKTVADLSALRTQSTDGSDYVAIAEGYINIPADGVYEFATNNQQLWIDGRLLVDNTQMVCPRYSPNNAQMALKAGLHRQKVVFSGGIFDGWPTYWDDAKVTMRKIRD